MAVQTDISSGPFFEVYTSFIHAGATAVTETFLDIKHWGNNLGVRLPAAVARAARLQADQRVRISVEGERVIIERVQDTPLTLEQRLARFAPERTDPPDQHRHGTWAGIAGRVAGIGLQGSRLCQPTTRTPLRV